MTEGGMKTSETGVSRAMSSVCCESSMVLRDLC